MFRWLVICGLLCGGAFYLVSWAAGKKIGVDGSITDRTSESPRNTEPQGADPKETPPPTGAPALRRNPAAGMRDDNRTFTIQGARIVVGERQEVPADKDGMILWFGTPLKEGEEKALPPNKLIEQQFPYLAVEVAYDQGKPGMSFPLANTTKTAEMSDYMVPLMKDGKPNFFWLVEGGTQKAFTRWKEGMPLFANHARLLSETRKFRKLEEQDNVQKDDFLALINPAAALIELRSKFIKLKAAEAERVASEKTRDEAKKRWETLEKLRQQTPGSVSLEELRGAELQFVRYLNEEIGKAAQVHVAEEDVIGAMKMVTLHEVHAQIPGVIKTIYKNRGDGVRSNMDQLLQIQNVAQLRAEAMVDVADAQKLEKGMGVSLEVSLSANPFKTLSGPLQEITAVAVNGGAHRFVIAASQDKSVRGWDASTWQEAWKLEHLPSPPRTLACTPKTAKQDLLLVGLSDGSSFVYNLADDKGLPITLSERHKGPVTCAAFNADGTLCATSGEDKAIILWSIKDDGKRIERVQRLPEAHRSPVTSLAFGNDGRLISAGRDQYIIVWDARPDHPLVKIAEFDKRSGDVTQIGTDGDRILFDAGNELRVLSLRDKELGQIEGTLKNASPTGTFSTLALFSPDGRAVLTAGGLDGRPQLWRAPLRGIAAAKGEATEGQPEQSQMASSRGSELRTLASEHPVTCGAFSPDGAFAVTGTTNNKVLIWTMPTREEMEMRVPATVTMVEGFVQGKQVRVWAELKQHPKWLVPGSTATVVVDLEDSAKK